MSVLFEPTRIGGLELANRFVRSATFESCAEPDGGVSDRLIDLLSALADGGVGLIVAGVVHVHPLGRISPRQASMAEDRFVDAWGRLTEEVHRRGGKIAPQIFHAGREAALYLGYIGQEALGPSVVPDDPYFEHTNRALTDA
ncbi:MAG: NADH:flavin oxidoreductase, partial [Proteobacteria bacterium]|nr:NADH:flavin oxidoreductase [Pseudomonadota bacterium]